MGLGIPDGPKIHSADNVGQVQNAGLCRTADDVRFVTSLPATSHPALPPRSAFCTFPVSVLVVSVTFGLLISLVSMSVCKAAREPAALPFAGA